MLKFYLPTDGLYLSAVDEFKYGFVNGHVYRFNADNQTWQFSSNNVFNERMVKVKGEDFRFYQPIILFDEEEI